MLQKYDEDRQAEAARKCSEIAEERPNEHSYTPAISLTRLIAEKQAEALDEVSENMVDTRDTKTLRWEARELRRQAEEGNI